MIGTEILCEIEQGFFFFLFYFMSSYGYPVYLLLHTAQ